MTRRSKIMIGMMAGGLWACLVLWAAAQFVTLPVFTLMPTIMTAFFAPGAVALLMVGRLAQRRFFDETVMEGGAFPTGSRGEIDQRVLTNTVEQLALALCIWPAAAVILAADGPGVITVLGVNFALMRVVFWVGYHRSVLLRAFGFAASFYPTVLVTIWTVYALFTYGA